MSDIARRVDHSLEAVRLWSNGKRGGGLFPGPVAAIGQKSQQWRWSEVAGWLLEREIVGPEVVERAFVIAELNVLIEVQRLADDNREGFHRIMRYMEDVKKSFDPSSAPRPSQLPGPAGSADPKTPHGHPTPDRRKSSARPMRRTVPRTWLQNARSTAKNAGSMLASSTAESKPPKSRARRSSAI